MRLIIRVFFIIFVLYILLILSIPSVEAICGFDLYNRCTGTCSCECGGTCTCQLDGWGDCVPSGCNTNCPQPTNTPPRPTTGASPTATTAPTPTTGGIICPPQNLGNCRNATEWCMSQKCNCTCTPNGITNCAAGCSSICTNGHCHTTQPTPGNDVQCTTWGAWSACLSGQSTCAACAAQGYTCQTRFCADPPNSNQYQISCGCNNGGGGGGSTARASAPAVIRRVPTPETAKSTPSRHRRRNTPQAVGCNTS